jgi:hypothetical protein
MIMQRERKQESNIFRVVFWDVLPCKMIVDRRFRGAYCPHHQGCSTRCFYLALMLTELQFLHNTYHRSFRQLLTISLCFYNMQIVPY